MARQLNDETIEHIKRWEGLRLKAYPDPGSRNGEPWTIGYGHVSDDYFKVFRGLTISEEKAADLLLHDLEETVAAVDSLVKVSLTDNQFGALVSFAFNVGVGAFKKSTLLKKLNASQYNAVPGELAKWKYNDGKPMDGLINRRAAEAGLWAKGAFVSSNNVAVEPEKKPILDKETVTWGAGIGTTVFGAFSGAFNSTGPVAIALAVVLVGLFGLGAYWLIKSRMFDK